MEFVVICIISFVVVSSFYYLSQSRIRTQRVPSSIGQVGLRNEAVGTARACIREFTSGLETMASGYKKFSENAQPFIMPTPSFETHIMLPREHIKWLIDQPEDILSHGKVHGEKLGLRYLFPGFDYNTDMAIATAIRLHLTRNLATIQDDLMDEIQSATDAVLGLDDQSWTEVNLFTSMSSIVSQSSGIVFFGRSLSSNARFMQSMQRFGDIFGAGILSVGQLTPRIFRRMVGSLFLVPLSYYLAVCTRYLWPVFSDRLKSMNRDIHDNAFNYEAPKDLITWMLRAALDTKGASIEDPGPLVKRFTLVTSGAISSSSVTLTNTLLDILSSDPKLHYYQTLREEAESVFLATGDQKRPSASLGLRHMDSAIRESLRRNPILVRGLWREVVPKNGITLPDGQHLQQGAWLSVPVPGIHHDERFYPEPQAYDPFRFVPGIFLDVETAKEKNADAENCKPAMLTMTSDTFLPFGHARHSWYVLLPSSTLLNLQILPGRWFASHHIKLVLAYIFLHYDIQGMPERPLNHIWGEHPVPPPGTVIKVKRRAVG
ncbi:unnamed protein product [Penicillium salamii]|nr:unnamed protein product [Penicillium salamii]